MRVRVFRFSRPNLVNTNPSEGQHRLEEIDEVIHLIAYSLTKGQPLGMRSYRVSISLTPAPDGCDLAWEGRFDAAPEVNAVELALGLKAAYESMTELFERYVIAD